MTDSIAPITQSNFLPGNLPANSEAFYNSKSFAHNELQFLSTMISMDDKAQERGLHQIKDAIEGLS
jgi:hypothetical protein